MKSRKLFRGPFIWILVAFAVLTIGLNSVNTSGFTKVDTSVGLQFIENGAAKSVLVIEN